MPDEPAPEQLVLTADVGRVRVVTLHRPSAANAFNGELCAQLATVLQTAASDDAVSVAVITGAGPVFTGGIDLHQMTDRSETDATTVGLAAFADFLAALSTFPKPILAAVNGAAVGIGVTMLFHVDLVLLAERARLRMPFTAMGVVPEAASTLRLPALVGRQRAAELMFTAEWVEAPRAVELGLARSVHRDDALLDDALTLATRIAEQPLPSLMATKRLLLAPEADAIVATVARENAAFSELLALPDADARVLAQLDKSQREVPRA